MKLPQSALPDWGSEIFKGFQNTVLVLRNIKIQEKESSYKQTYLYFLQQLFEVSDLEGTFIVPTQSHFWNVWLVIHSPQRVSEDTLCQEKKKNWTIYFWWLFKCAPLNVHVVILQTLQHLIARKHNHKYTHTHIHWRWMLKFMESRA